MGRGRPLGFDPDEALGKAMLLFWRDGYEGASLTELTEAMGINRRSLYATFGSKEKLFLRATDRYLRGPGGFVAAALTAPTAREVTERILRSAVDAYTTPGCPRGCLLVQSALTVGGDAEAVRRELADRRAAGIASMRERFEKARAEDDLPADANAEALARYLAALLQGISVQAVGGASRAELRMIAETALAAWSAISQGPDQSGDVSRRREQAAGIVISQQA